MGVSPGYYGPEHPLTHRGPYLDKVNGYLHIFIPSPFWLSHKFVAQMRRWGFDFTRHPAPQWHRPVSQGKEFEAIKWARKLYAEKWGIRPIALPPITQVLGPFQIDFPVCRICGADLRTDDAASYIQAMGEEYHAAYLQRSHDHGYCFDCNGGTIEAKKTVATIQIAVASRRGHDGGWAARITHQGESQIMISNDAPIPYRILDKPGHLAMHAIHTAMPQVHGVARIIVTLEDANLVEMLAGRQAARPEFSSWIRSIAWLATRHTVIYRQARPDDELQALAEQQMQKDRA